MVEHDDGGPAFPMPSGMEPRVNTTTHFNEGMSLRDWFAGMAMQSLLINPDYADEIDDAAAEEGVDIHDLASHLAFDLADAMLKARA
jgi:hypothetical protein